ncbi:MAG: multiprotein bridging factor aMBF1 [Candidatus Nanoarchaeia archaeon]
MPTCDMCGREGPTKKAIVEGSMMDVCSKCSMFGNVIEVSPPKVDVKESPKPKPTPTTKPEPSPVLVVVPDYAARVRAAREKMLYSQEELAKAIAEKESVIHKIESSQLEPPVKLARKLELFLKIELLKELKRDDSDKPKKFDLKDSTLTIGDLVRLRNRDK